MLMEEEALRLYGAFATACRKAGITPQGCIELYMQLPPELLSFAEDNDTFDFDGARDSGDCQG